MKIVLATIVLDGYPQISWHLPVFNQLSFDWRWLIAEGAADNVRCTSWCSKPEPRLSRDGTHEYLEAIKVHPRVRIWQQPLWPGKVAMFNTMLESITEDCLLVQIDSDEVWSAAQLEGIRQFFLENDHYSTALFRCNFFVGQHIVTTGQDVYGDKSQEWQRVWRFTPGDRFASHEPPILGNPANQSVAGKDITEQRIGRFSHYAYAFESQVAFKEKYYRYPDAVRNWWNLQRNTKWPVKRLKTFLPWVDEGAGADLVYKL